MRYLLDTHIWIWSLSDPDKLSKEVRAILSDPVNQLFISTISIWEFLVLVEKERIFIDGTIDEWLAIAIDEADIKELPLDKTIAIHSRRIDLPHQDPADRFIAATAKVNELTLITSDKKIVASTRSATTKKLVDFFLFKILSGFARLFQNFVNSFN